MARWVRLVLITCSTATLAARQQRSQQPMTPWGEPDLRGMWPLNHLISAPVSMLPRNYNNGIRISVLVLTVSRWRSCGRLAMM